MPAGEASTKRPNQIEYKGHLIWAVQTGDGSWIATHTRIGSEPDVAADGFPPVAQEMDSFVSPFIAIASAELAIDELEKKSKREPHPGAARIAAIE
jgi:hypothetical protein